MGVIRNCRYLITLNLKILQHYEQCTRQFFGLSTTDKKLKIYLPCKKGHISERAGVLNSPILSLVAPLIEKYHQTHLCTYDKTAPLRFCLHLLCALLFFKMFTCSSCKDQMLQHSLLIVVHYLALSNGFKWWIFSKTANFSLNSNTEQFFYQKQYFEINLSISSGSFVVLS